jgi:hypothetical protein
MSQIVETIIKPPTAVRFHSIDLRAWLDDGEAVTAQTVESNSPGLLVDQATNNAGEVSYRVRGGDLDSDPIVTLQVETSAGRVEPFFVQYRIRKPG